MSKTGGFWAHISTSRRRTTRRRRRRLKLTPLRLDFQPMRSASWSTAPAGTRKCLDVKSSPSFPHDEDMRRFDSDLKPPRALASLFATVRIPWTGGLIPLSLRAPPCRTLLAGSSAPAPTLPFHPPLSCLALALAPPNHHIGCSPFLLRFRWLPQDSKRDVPTFAAPPENAIFSGAPSVRPCEGREMWPSR